jgi:hypothetical protein
MAIQLCNELPPARYNVQCLHDLIEHRLRLTASRLYVHLLLETRDALRTYAAFHGGPPDLASFPVTFISIDFVGQERDNHI